MSMPVVKRRDKAQLKRVMASAENPEAKLRRYLINVPEMR